MNNERTDVRRRSRLTDDGFIRNSEPVPCCVRVPWEENRTQIMTACLDEKGGGALEGTLGVHISPPAPADTKGKRAVMRCDDERHGACHPLPGMSILPARFCKPLGSVDAGGPGSAISHRYHEAPPPRDQRPATRSVNNLPVSSHKSCRHLDSLALKASIYLSRYLAAWLLALVWRRLQFACVQEK